MASSASNANQKQSQTLIGAAVDYLFGGLAGGDESEWFKKHKKAVHIHNHNEQCS